MSLSLGLFDIFSYISPGMLYIFMAVYAGNSFPLWNIDIQKQIETATTPQTIIVIGIGYLVGICSDIITRKIWYRFFRGKKSIAERILDDFRYRYPQLKLNFEEKETPILFANIKHRYPDLGTYIDRQKAICIMFRNISFCLFLLGLVELTNLLRNGNLVPHITFLICAIGLSVIAGLQAVRFDEWFISTIYESTIAQNINSETWVERKNAQRLKTKSNT